MINPLANLYLAKEHFESEECDSLSKKHFNGEEY